MHVIDYAVPFALAGVATGCAACSEQVPSRRSDAGSAADPATAEVAPPPAPVLDAPASIPAAFIVSTNEPFWQVRVEGDTVVLSGPSVQRRFRTEANQVVFDGRYVTARDASGTLETRVTERLCQDSMSGAVLPFTARVVIDDGTPVLGCARAASDPSGAQR